jgi:hypothetical protein
MAMAARRNPKWWTREHDSAWERVKEAFQRDWEQTKHDFGGDEPDLDQDVDDTVGQAVGSRPIPPPGQPNFSEYEDAFRFGYGAQQHYGSRYSEWNEDLERELRRDFGDSDWDRCRPAIRHGWDYDKMSDEMSKSSGRVLER